MPTYLYYQCGEIEGYTEERNVPMDERDTQFCNRCGILLKRKIAFNGATIVK